MENQSKPHPVIFARQHYARVKDERARLDLRYRIHLNHSVGHRLLGHKHPNQYTKRQLLDHFGPFQAGAWWTQRLEATWLHGRICIPHPACPEAFALARWITYADAVAITGRSAETFARWRWDLRTLPDEAVWRLLEWSLHGCCAWPSRPLRARPRPASGDLGALPPPRP